MSKGAYLTAAELRAAVWLIWLAGIFGTALGAAIGACVALWVLR